MLKILVIVYLNVASILAVNDTLYQYQISPVSYRYIEWKIQNVSDLRTEIDYCFNSSTFSFANSKWHFSIFPNGISHPTDTTVNVYLSSDDFAEKYQAKVSMGLIKNDGIEFYPRADHTFNKVYSYWRWFRGIYRDQFTNDIYAPGGILTVFCRIEIMNGTEVIPQITSSSSGKCTKTLSDNLMALYTSKRFTDVTIICKSKEFAAHKIILTYRLPAFDSLLEKNPDKIEIPDCDPETFEEILRFIYSGKLVDMSTKKVMTLYLTAAKFNMHELKEECARYIAEHVLNIDSFYDIRRFAILQSDSMLLMSTTEFFITNATLILSTDKWENDPLLVNKLFLAYVEKKSCEEEKK